MKSNVVVRSARLADAADLSALMRRTFVAANGHCSTPDNLAAFLESTYRPEVQAREIRDPDTLTLIVEQDRQWAGFAQLRWGTTPPAEVDPLPTVELGRIYRTRLPWGGIAASLSPSAVAATCADRVRCG